MPFFLVPFLIQLAVSVALMTLAYIIAPKPKQEKPEAQDLQEPKAEAGKPIPVVFGTKTVSGLNILWYGEKTTKKYGV